MKFSKVVGKLDPNLVAQAEKKLEKVWLELALRYDNKFISNSTTGSGMGGDPLIFSLVYPTEHIATPNIATAATDGKRFFWNPKFVLKQSIMGLRMIVSHEAWHAIFMHPSRRGSRNPKLWNIAVDYVVNGAVMEDLKARDRKPGEEFTKNLGRYMPLKSMVEMAKNPFAKIPGFEDLKGLMEPDQAASGNVKLPKPLEDRELTISEQKELERREKGCAYYYADPDLEDDMKKPERIYELIYQLLPKCPDCGSLGIYKKPNKSKDQENQEGEEQDGKDKGKNKKSKSKKGSQPGDGQGKGQKSKGGRGDHSDQHEHSEDGDPCDCKDHGNQPGDQSQDQQGDGQGDGDQQSDQQGQGSGGSFCPKCWNDHCQTCGNGCGGDGVDIFGLGGTVDDHMDSEETQEKMAKRIAEAMEAAKKMAGFVPAGLQDELGELCKPQITWQDVIRGKLLKARQGNDRNDWTKFRTRPMFSGLMVPKRKTYYATFGVLLDCSGSMSQEDIAFGVSQLQAIDDKGCGTIVPADAEIYYDQAVQIKNCKSDELRKIKVCGRGGTMFGKFFLEYEREIGKCDLLICITDGYLIEEDYAKMYEPKIPVYWLITSGVPFKPAFGKVYSLHNETI